MCNLAGKRCSPASSHNFISGDSPCKAIRSPFVPTRLTLNTHNGFFTHIVSISLGGAARILTTSTHRGNTSIARILIGYIVFGSNVRGGVISGRFHTSHAVFLHRNRGVLFNGSGRGNVILRNLGLGTMAVNRSNCALSSILMRSTRRGSGALRVVLTVVDKSVPITLNIVHSISTPACSRTMRRRVRRIRTGGPVHGLRSCLVDKRV